jgi:hypothetical protein
MIALYNSAQTQTHDAAAAAAAVIISARQCVQRKNILADRLFTSAITRAHKGIVAVLLLRQIPAHPSAAAAAHTHHHGSCTIEAKNIDAAAVKNPRAAKCASFYNHRSRCV